MISYSRTEGNSYGRARRFGSPRFVGGTGPTSRLRKIEYSLRVPLLVLLFLTLFLRGSVSEHVFGSSPASSGEHESMLVRFAVEAVIVLVIAGLWRRHRPPVAFCMALAYVFWSLFAGMCSPESSPIDGFKYARYTFYGFALYHVFRIPGWQGRELKMINGFVVSLFLMQIGASVLHAALFGRVEWRVGTMTVSGGELATLFPLFAIGGALGYYFYIRQSLWVMLIALSFTIVGYASGKRAIYFLVPCHVLLCVLIYLLRSEHLRANTLRRILRHAAICALIALPLWLYGMDRSYGLSSGNPHASVVERFTDALRFASEYERGELSDGRTMGRTSTSIKILRFLSSADIWRILFGFGPNAFSESRGEQEGGGYGFSTLHIAYGITGWSMDVVSIGVPGMVLFLAAYGAVVRDMMRAVSIETLPCRWRAIHFGVLLGFILTFYMYFFYSGIVVTANPVTLTLLAYAGLLTGSVSRREPMSVPVRQHWHYRRRQMITLAGGS